MQYLVALIWGVVLLQNLQCSPHCRTDTSSAVCKCLHPPVTGLPLRKFDLAPCYVSLALL